MKSIMKVGLIFFWAVMVDFVSAQNRPWLNPYSDWSAKDVNKILSESPWAQKQIISDTSQMVFSPTQGGGSHQAQNTNSIIRFLSAKPIRHAIGRSIELDSKSTQAQFESARKFSAAEYPDTIVIAVSFESADPQYSLQANSRFFNATTSLLTNNTYLQVSNGQRVFLKEYHVPEADGLGANFIFPRLVDGKQFITPET